MPELTHSRNGPVRVGAAVESKIRLSWCEGGGGHMEEVCFVCCADIVVVAPEAVGDDILGGWIHNGCGELIIV